ncbi:hypothetical protein SASPL_104786 [Salvia splendens]|uniref:DNA (Cytosine-5)-methyltransferase 1 n=1 Tax=Salvia splendens TaxID=180675 RepID=A0A8X8YI56_SALSN|nr:hypothetical protein SASPL_104786 [Salvia splendens]
MYLLNEDAYVKTEEGKESYICKIVELFQAVDGKQLFSVQWYYRADDTVIKSCANLIDNKKIFFSEVKDDNPLDCLEKKVDNILISKLIPAYDYFCDKMYLLPYTSFVSLPSETESYKSPTNNSESGSTISSDAEANSIPHFPEIERQCGDVVECRLGFVLVLTVAGSNLSRIYSLAYAFILILPFVFQFSVYQIRWKGYGPEYDTWEPLNGLSSCPEEVKEFVLRGYKSRILPLPLSVLFFSINKLN